MSTRVRDEIAQLVEELLNVAVVDADKHSRGNAAAGTRLRKILMHVSNKCKELRNVIQEEKKAFQEAKKNG